MPVAGTVAAALGLGEPLTLTLLIGLALILGGVGAMTVADREPG